MYVCMHVCMYHGGKKKKKKIFYQVFTLSNIFGVGHSQSNKKKNSQKWQFWVGLDKLQNGILKTNVSARPMRQGGRDRQCFVFGKCPHSWDVTLHKNPTLKFCLKKKEKKKRKKEEEEEERFAQPTEVVGQGTINLTNCQHLFSWTSQNTMGKAEHAYNKVTKPKRDPSSMPCWQ